MPYKHSEEACLACAYQSGLPLQACNHCRRAAVELHLKGREIPVRCKFRALKDRKSISSCT